MYVTPQRYKEIACPVLDLTDGELERCIAQAEADVDAMTFCRIRVLGFDGLSLFQRERVEQAVCQQVNFKVQYGEQLENPLAAYSINGVSMTWDSERLRRVGGVYTSGSILTLLEQTGLTCRGLP